MVKSKAMNNLEMIHMLRLSKAATEMTYAFDDLIRNFAKGKETSSECEDKSLKSVLLEKKKSEEKMHRISKMCRIDITCSHKVESGGVHL
jgi:predicted methyltransferase